MKKRSGGQHRDIPPFPTSLRPRFLMLSKCIFSNFLHFDLDFNTKQQCLCKHQNSNKPRSGETGNVGCARHKVSFPAYLPDITVPSAFLLNQKEMISTPLSYHTFQVRHVQEVKPLNN